MHAVLISVFDLILMFDIHRVERVERARTLPGPDVPRKPVVPDVPYGTSCEQGKEMNPDAGA
jgi:hypothetical protein